MNTFTDTKEYMDNLSAFMEGNLSVEEWSQYCKRLLTELLEEDKTKLKQTTTQRLKIETTTDLPTSDASKMGQNPV